MLLNMLCLGASAIGSLTGVVNPIYTISVGYGAAMALQAAAAIFMRRPTMDRLAFAHAMLVGAYGVRLVGFLCWRDSLASFAPRRDAIQRRAASLGVAQVWTMMLGCTGLYAAMFVPVMLNSRQGLAVDGGVSTTASISGLVVAACALAWETASDITQQLYFEKGGVAPCEIGPWKLMQHPNYFGEVIFWQAGWLAAFRSYRTAWEGLMAGIGVLGITLIIIEEGSRREKRA